MRKSVHTKDYATFLSLLIEERQKAGITQAQLGGKVSFGQPGISKIERGERRVDVIELRLICQAIGISFKDFTRNLEAKLASRRDE